MKVQTTLGALLLASGCASSFVQRPLRTDHPANPETTIPVPYRRANSIWLAGPDSEIAATQESDEGYSNPPTTKSAGSHQHAESDPAEVEYTCPMHLEIVSKNPDDRCPKCGMALERRSALNTQEAEP